MPTISCLRGMFDDHWEFVKIKIAKNPNFHKQLVCMSRNVDPTTEDIGKRILVNPVWLWNPGNRSWLLFLFCHVGECVWLVIWEKSHIALTIRVCWVCLQILAGITRYASNPSVGNHKRTGIHKICKFTQQYECLTWLSSMGCNSYRVIIFIQREIRFLKVYLC